jgi:flagellar assembly protein FliH
MNLLSRKIIKDCPTNAYAMPCLGSRFKTDQGESRPSKKTPEAIEREAYEKGYDSGEKAGYEMGKQKADLLVKRLENISKGFEALQGEKLSQLEPQVVILAIAMARKILKEELSLHPEIIGKMVKEALNKICKTGPVTIKLNRSVYDLLEEKKEEFQMTCPDLIFELDDQVSDGGAVVHCISEEVQTDLDFQLSNIVEELRNKLKNA